MAKTKRDTVLHLDPEYRRRFEDPVIRLREYEIRTESEFQMEKVKDALMVEPASDPVLRSELMDIFFVKHNHNLYSLEYEHYTMHHMLFEQLTTKCQQAFVNRSCTREEMIAFRAMVNGLDCFLTPYKDLAAEDNEPTSWGRNPEDKEAIDFRHFVRDSIELLGIIEEFLNSFHQDTSSVAMLSEDPDATMLMEDLGDAILAAMRSEEQGAAVLPEIPVAAVEPGAAMLPEEPGAAMLPEEPGAAMLPEEPGVAMLPEEPGVAMGPMTRAQFLMGEIIDSIDDMPLLGGGNGPL